MPAVGQHTVDLWRVMPAPMSPERVVVFALLGVLVILGLFVLLALIRFWGIRLQKGSAVSRNLDLEALRRQREAGEISQEEYEAICNRMASLGPAGKPAKAPARPGDLAPPGAEPAERPIKETGTANGRPERSIPDGQE